MNNNIKKLSDQCYDDFKWFDKEQFAELIIKECTTIILKSSSSKRNLIKEIEDYYEIDYNNNEL